MSGNRERIAMKVSTESLIGNIVLSAGKLAAGLLAHSSAMVSDAVHSASDVFSTVVVMLGVRMAGREADRAHPYGHDRFESVCGAILATVLLATGLAIGRDAVIRLTEPRGYPMPGLAALVMAVLSVIVKELMYRRTIHAAKQINSPALRADAWHHRSDALSSVGSFAGILGARLGLQWADAAAGLIICLFILRAAWEILTEAARGVVDCACSPETEQAIRDTIQSVPGVQRIDILHTRMAASRIWVDVEIAVDGDMLLREAHAIAESVHDAV